MNLKQLKKRQGTNLRLRPLPHRIDGSGKHLPESDDAWRLEKVLDNPSSIELLNIHTGHVLTLQPDNVQEYRSPDFLLLRCQLTVRPQSIDIEPIFGSAGSPSTPLRTRITDLLREINPEIMEAFGSGAPEVAVMISEHNLRVLQEIQREPGCSEILSLRPTGSMSVGVGSRVGGHIHDLDDIGVRQGFVLRFMV